jgi:hypothetical protein
VPGGRAELQRLCAIVNDWILQSGIDYAVNEGPDNPNKRFTETDAAGWISGSGLVWMPLEAVSGLLEWLFAH